MSYKVIKPLVPGTLAVGTKYIGLPGKRDVVDPVISFDYTPDQDIYKIHPIYFVSENFKVSYLASKVKGITDFIELRTKIAEEHFGEIKTYGKYFRIILSEDKQGNDFVKDKTKLLVSEDAINFLSFMKIDHVTFEVYDQDWHAKLLEEDRKQRENDSSLLGKIKKWFK